MAIIIMIGNQKCSSKRSPSSLTANIVQVWKYKSSLDYCCPVKSSNGLATTNNCRGLAFIVIDADALLLITAMEAGKRETLINIQEYFIAKETCQGAFYHRKA